LRVKKIPLFKMKSLILISVILAGIGFTACKTTPTPSASVPPPKQEKPETKETRPSTPSESTESAQPGAQEKSKTSQKTSPEASESQPQDAKPTSQKDQTASAGAAQTRTENTESTESTKHGIQKKSETSQTTSPEASESQPQDAKPTSQNDQIASVGETQTRPGKADQKSSESRTTGPQTTQSKLEKARDDLRVSQATEKRIAAELEKLKQSGNASAEDIRNYEAYHERVQAMVAENRKIVEKMEAAQARHSAAPKGSQAATSGESEKRSDPSIPEEQTQDQVAALDRELSASLGEFDAMLLKEMETIETESAAKMRDLAQEAAAAAKRLKEKGVDLGSDGSESTDGESKQGEEGQKGKAGEKDVSGKEKGSQTKQGSDDDAVATRDQSKGGGSGDRGSRYSKEDDDIVARQLREAAENETDPELKEKLWKEYEDYRRNTQ
jgi:hypothetical protein